MLAAPTIASDSVIFIFNGCARDWERLESDETAGLQRSLPYPYVRFEAAWRAVIELLAVVTTGWRNSKVALLAVHGSDSAVLWECSESAQEFPSSVLFTERLAKFIATEDPTAATEALLGLGFAQALCMLNAQKERVLQRFLLSQPQQPRSPEADVTSERSKASSRIVILDVGVSDYVHQFTWLVNMGLAAQRQNVCVDVCNVGSRSVAVLEQMVELTGGIYLNFARCISEQLKEDRAKGTSLGLRDFGKNKEYDKKILGQMLTSFLIFHYSVPPQSREILPTAYTSMGDCSAVCRCHHRVVEVGLVCSCCLAIFCHEYKDPICAVCRVRFKRERDVTVATVKLTSSKRVLPDGNEGGTSVYICLRRFLKW